MVTCRCCLFVLSHLPIKQRKGQFAHSKHPRLPKLDSDMSGACIVGLITATYKWIWTLQWGCPASLESNKSDIILHDPSVSHLERTEKLPDSESGQVDLQLNYAIRIQRRL